MLSKLGVLAERGIKKSKKHHAIAPAALGGCGGLGQLWEALAELWEALGELWEGLYIEKLSINRLNGLYVKGNMAASRSCDIQNNIWWFPVIAKR